MTGTVSEAYLTELQEDTDEAQGSLFDFADNDRNETTVAVVSDPSDTGILEAVDEHIEALGMPSWKLNEFRRLRSAMTTMNSVESHNKAYEKLDMDDAYLSHLEYNEEAQEALQSLAERVAVGEDITLVCFEKSPKRCHRHVLKDRLEQLVAGVAEA